MSNANFVSELYQATTSTMISHDSHIAGLIRLFQSQNSLDSLSKLGKEIYQIAKWNAVCLSLTFSHTFLSLLRNWRFCLYDV